MLRHDKSLSSHKFSEYDDDIFKPNKKSSGNLVDNYLSLKSSKNNKKKKVSPTSNFLDINNLVDQQSVRSKRSTRSKQKKIEKRIEVDSGSSSSDFRKMASIAIIESNTPRKGEKDHLKVSKYNSVSQSKPSLVKIKKTEDSP